MIFAPIAPFVIFVLCAVQSAQHVNEIRRGAAAGKHDRSLQVIALPAVYGTCALCALAQLYELRAEQVGLGPTLHNATDHLTSPTGNLMTSVGQAIVGFLGSTPDVNGLNVVPLAVNVTALRLRYLAPKLMNSSALALTGAVSMLSVGASLSHRVLDENHEQLVLAQSESYYCVADLYEAWALYQFGQLALELVWDGLRKVQRRSVANPDRQHLVDNLLGASEAVERLANMGVYTMLVVSILQAGWSVIMLSSVPDWAAYKTRSAQFAAAGMVASGAAIYNIHIVDVTFHHYLETYRPFLKFLSVKIIVSLAWFQHGFIWLLKNMKLMMTPGMQSFVDSIPVVGSVLTFSEVEFEMFYGSLMLYECVIIALLHWWAWGAHEPWYHGEEDHDSEEKQGLLEEGTEKVSNDAAPARLCPCLARFA